MKFPSFPHFQHAQNPYKKTAGRILFNCKLYSAYRFHQNPDKGAFAVCQQSTQIKSWIRPRHWKL